MNAQSSIAASSEQEAFDQLQCYTLAKADAAFIHQHVVDVWTAQRADAQTKPIAITFSLIGLYLHVERGFTGRQVQQVHMALARFKRAWPTWPLPLERGKITALLVLSEPAGPARDSAIDAWCAAVWTAFADQRQAIATLLKEHCDL